ncbi:MAG: hypothetical protein COY73_00315 [Candidatus Nealsonbacteria bacterium CG_4_10_14_0_8_um_filter_37_14]|uniref:Baseplate protein J-like domain-containing protein n=1 Tax=Candidatus Nealsonbacteria bacterium CG_4_10_14_0_8_um_filter_37_14 TaxID=1974684 RepID=A0A2M7R7S3_9BACT|nr:MAG: hypothetical protein COY73_00315 [Candidatus Nealsonbacteria bacterium CG_4_10_14_0_8_um_filter_37_14]
MEQKIYDIIPPEAVQERGFGIEKKPPEERGRFFKKRFWAPLIFLILIGVAAFFFIEPKAEIEIWPKTKVQDFETQIALDKTLESLNSPILISNATGAIPAKIIDIEKTVSQEFTASEIITKESKARGKIRAYNNYSTLLQSFVPQTRFMSDSGKVFMIQEKITVPGKKLENGKWAPGFVDVEVIAAEAGPDYNIPPSTFSIPGLKGTPLYTFFYAKSFEPMKGGAKAEAHQVTEKDLKNAKEVLIEKALQESKNYLIKEVPQDWTLMEELIESEIVEVSPLAETGQELESFIVQVKAKSQGLVFKKSDLNQWVGAYIRSNIGPDYEISPQGFDIKYFLSPQKETTKNIEKSKIVLNLDLSAKIYSKVDTEAIKRQILGKEPIQIQRDVLKNFSEINKVEVKLWPFWKTSAPLEVENIKINLNFEG